ncbi:17-beta-hydroxysteroid dehydrogenase type 2 isoform X2 [Camelus dromedarius]|uniref:Estradiol 17-beta-dehydrogenase 2 isoform X3 n=2 Tax=Camelus TaxID=9836 RepID=A0A8B8TKI5_CAMFR|nr:estradiol 17-beta-dehydrogenase 2 isoform X2 [Camelus dromedarius]XP_032342746.1 estradiol 17-beta-dehydrogenase 2 isoform X3 [Camelus ferus]XP_045361414.1 17-beta-hydroxysteroid dehydrogenase type 2 isoform X3 [Camelus bactrianus]
MGTFFSEMAWLCLAVTAVLGGTILWRLNKSQGQVGKKVVCLAGLWGGACLLSLPLFWGLFLFSLSCFIMYTYFSGQEFLPVDQKAILITGLWAVVNNAGIFSYPADGELTPMTEYKRCMAVNFFGTVEVTKAFLPLLRKSKGRLVNISSLAGAIPMERLAAYSSSKAALTMFSAVLRQELSNWGVKVSVIQPGGFQTNITGTSDMWDKLEKSILDHLPPDVQEDYGQDYIHRQRGYLRLINNFSDPNISPVLLDIHHAISAKSPCAFYAPGKMTYPWIYFVSFSPTGIFDYFAKKKHGHGKIMPRALSKPNVKNEAI